VKKYARFVGYNEKSEAFLERHFARHKGKTFLLAKISHGIGGAVQITAGIAGVSSAEFIFWSLIGTLPKTLILMTLGYYLGTSYLKIDDLFNSIAIAVLIVAAIGVLAYVLAGRFGRKQFDKS
jgi:membrane protein DedA with SNARE-associated domain